MYNKAVNMLFPWGWERGLLMFWGASGVNAYLFVLICGGRSTIIAIQENLPGLMLLHQATPKKLMELRSSGGHQSLIT